MERFFNKDHVARRRGDQKSVGDHVTGKEVTKSFSVGEEVAEKVLSSTLLGENERLSGCLRREVKLFLLRHCSYACIFSCLPLCLTLYTIIAL